MIPPNIVQFLSLFTFLHKYFCPHFLISLMSFLDNRHSNTQLPIMHSIVVYDKLLHHQEESEAPSRQVTGQEVSLKMLIF